MKTSKEQQFDGLQRFFVAALFVNWLVLLYGSGNLHAQNTRYPLPSIEGHVDLGFYEIDNGGSFITAKPGTLTFSFSNGDYKADFNSPDIVSTGKQLRWTPQPNSVTRNITIRVVKISDASVVINALPVTLYVRSNQQPRCIFQSCEAAFYKELGQPLQIKLTDYIVDDENDNLTYVWTSNPSGFPTIGTDGTLVIPAAMTGPNDKIGIVGVRDAASGGSVNFIVKISFQQPQGPPKFLPSTDNDNKIYLEQTYFQGDPLTPYAVKAINPTDNADLPVQIIGATYGLSYTSGFLGGSFAYDAVSNDLSEDEIGTVFTKTLTLQSTSAHGTSTAKIIFKIKWKAGPPQFDRYNSKRAAVKGVIDSYQNDALEKWEIIYADLNKVKNRKEVMEAIGGGLDGIGGLGVFATSTPLTTIVGGLAIVQGQITSLLKKKEKRILSNISLLVSAISNTSKPIDDFLGTYKEVPERQSQLTDKQLNAMDEKKMEIDQKLAVFRQSITAITTVLND